MFVKIGGVKVRIKPAMLVLIGAVIVGCVVTFTLRHTPSQQAPSYGYANPRGWRFEARQGAVATATAAMVPAPGSATAADPEKSTTAPTVVDAEHGFTVIVTKTGPTADCVYLRNAVNLDLNQDRHPIKLIYEARSGDGLSETNNTRPFPMTVTVRDANDLLWSKRVVAGSTWETHTETITLKKSALLNVIMAIHLGEATGAVQVRNMRVVDEG